MEFPADVADPLHQGRLDVHVDIFEFRTELESILLNFLADFLRATAQFVGIRRP